MFNTEPAADTTQLEEGDTVIVWTGGGAGIFYARLEEAFGGTASEAVVTGSLPILDFSYEPPVEEGEALEVSPDEVAGSR